MSRALILCCGLLVLGAGFGGRHEAAPSPDGVAVEVTRTVTYPASNPQPTQPDFFSLTCDPAAGTLPFAERICRDIREHPQAMLAPRDLLGTKRCAIPVIEGRATVTFTIVLVRRDGYRSELPESPNCKDPGRIGRNIFAAATYGDEGVLVLLERGLQCAEEPIASRFATMSPTNRQACMFGSWTDSNRAMIRAAAQAPAMAALNPSRLFPADPGSRPCRIPVGGANGRTVRGYCGVYVTGATVTFVEDWSGHDLIWRNIANGAFKDRKGSGTMRHSWDVVVLNGRARSVTEQGAVTPQQRI